MINPHPESFKGFLLASYKSIANVARAHKITRLMLFTYLLTLVVVPPICITLAFLTFPTQTASFFNFNVNPQVLGESTSNPSHKEGSVLGRYVAAVLEPQATVTVQALRVIRPEAVSNIVLPEEQSNIPQPVQTTTSISNAPGETGANGARGETGPAGQTGPAGPTGATGSVGSLTTGSGLTGELTSGNLTLNLDDSIPTSTSNDTNLTGTIASNVLTLSWSGQLSEERGGTGQSSIPQNGQLLIGNGSGYTLSDITGGSNVEISNGSGSITIGTSDTPTFTTINGLTITNNGSNSLNIAGSKTLAVNNTLTFSGTDSSSFTLPSSSDTLVGLSSIDTLTNKTIAAGPNTISGLTNSNLSGSAGITNANLANSSLTITPGSGLTGGGSISLGSSAALNIALTSSGTTGATSSNSGLEVSGSGLSLIKGCSDSQLLKWTDAGGWACANDITGSADLQHVAAYDTNEAMTNVTSTQTALGTVSITPSTATGDVFVTGQADVYSGDGADQPFTLVIETTSNCSGTTVGNATVTYTITSGASNVNDRGSLIVSGVAVDPGASIQSYSLCASTSAGDTNVINWRLEATVIDTGADVAEIYTANDSSIEPGDVVSIDSSLSTGIKKSQQDYDSTVLGIVTTNPGLVIGGVNKEGTIALPIALAGRVPVKVSTVNGAIHAGDYLTSSTIPGVAMKATKTGAIIGVAMSDFNSQNIGTVFAFVKNSLHQEFPEAAIDLAAQEPLITKLLQQLASFLGNTANGISDFFASQIHSTTLCLGDGENETCITKSQLDEILSKAESPSTASADQ